MVSRLRKERHEFPAPPALLGHARGGPMSAVLAAPQAAFKALADPTRREILVMLKTRGMTIAEVADNFDMTRAAVKKHLTILTDGGLVSVTAQGREKLNEIVPQGFAPITDWLTYFDLFWDEKLGDLAAAIEKEIHSDDPKEKP